MARTRRPRPTSRTKMGDRNLIITTFSLCPISSPVKLAVLEDHVRIRNTDILLLQEACTVFELRGYDGVFNVGEAKAETTEMCST